MKWGRAGVVAIALAVVVFGPLDPSGRLFVRAGAEVNQTIERVPDGWTIVLGRGPHAGPVVVEHPITLLGDPGAIVTGGESGIVVRGTHATIADVTVSGAELHGIEVEQGSAEMSSVIVRDLRDPYAQGIEIRNSTGYGVTEVRDSVVVGGQEGIVSHVAKVVFADNVVGETTMRGIAVTEMSSGVVENNIVTGALGSALYCGDMSHCEFRSNSTTEVQPGPGGARSAAGWGLVVHYDSRASSDGDRLQGVAGDAVAIDGSHIQDRSPLRRGRGWGALVPVTVASAIAIALLAAGWWAARRPARKLIGASTRPSTVSRLGIAGLFAGIVIQSFHMSEHLIQVSRVHADGVPSRGGLVGSVVETEWVHWVYNALVLGGFVLLAWARRRGFSPRPDSWRGDGFVLAGLALQGYHVIEHTAKLAQHLATGTKVNPGILGAGVDLVWLHYTINLAVYLAAIAAARWYLPRWRAKRVPDPGSAAGARSA